MKSRVHWLLDKWATAHAFWPIMAFVLTGAFFASMGTMFLMPVGMFLLLPPLERMYQRAVDRHEALVEAKQGWMGHPVTREREQADGQGANGPTININVNGTSVPTVERQSPSAPERPAPQRRSPAPSPRRTATSAPRAGVRQQSAGRQGAQQPAGRSGATLG